MASGTIEQTEYFHILSASGNCNNIVAPGLYSWGSPGPSNNPHVYSWMVVFGRNNSGVGTTQVVRSMAQGFEEFTWERHKLSNNTWTNWESNIETSGKFTRYGKTVIFGANSWQIAASTTVPEGFRPAANVIAVGIVATGGATSGTPGRVDFATDGTITLFDSNTKFLGTFVWTTL